MWQPLFEGEERERIRTSLDRITRALQPSAPWASRLDSSLNPSIAMGSAGLVLFHAYRHLAEPDGGFLAPVELWLERLLAASPGMLSLFGGVAGSGWVLAHLDGRVFDLDGDEWAEDVDATLLRELRGGDRTLNWDLVKGLAGSGIYWLERLPRASAREGLAALVDHLEAIGEVGADRVAWRCPAASFFFKEDRDNHPDGLYNLSVAHGTAGALGFLAGAAAAGSARARPLLASGLRWLLDHEQPEEAPAAFPMSYPPGDPERGAGQDVRLSWCRGDAGTAATLMAVARVLGDPEAEAAAARLALRAARRRGVQAGVGDPCLCHGTAGLAHLFNRMFQRTGDPELAEAARHWYHHTLHLLRDDMGETGGCWSWQKEHDTWGDAVRRPEPAFLLGAAGVGLALLAAVSDVEPAWDRLLLASLATETHDAHAVDRAEIASVAG